MQAEVRIERYADQGRCVGHIDGRVVFVRFALPGELVRVVLDEPHDREDRFWTGEVTEVLEASEDRVEPVWPLAGPLAMGGGVGGADLVHVSLPGQLKWKSTSIAEQMRRLGHVDVDVPIERMPEDEAEQGLHWRTRIEMIADENGRPSMRRRGTHVRVPIDTMPLASRALLNVAEKEHVWDGGFTPGSQIRLSVPEPRGNAEIADKSLSFTSNWSERARGLRLRAGDVFAFEGAHHRTRGERPFRQCRDRRPAARHETPLHGALRLLLDVRSLCAQLSGTGHFARTRQVASSVLFLFRHAAGEVCAALRLRQVPGQCAVRAGESPKKDKFRF